MTSRPERWVAPDLSGHVACVTGASYGVGRAIAEVLGECGATVYVTGRSTRSSPSKDQHWTIEETASLVDEAGGHAIPLQVDHTDEAAVGALVRRIGDRHGRLDTLVNSVWQWGPRDSYWAPTWEQPAERWDAMFGVGARSLFLTTASALPLMIEHGGLIVSTQERPGDSRHFGQNIVVDAAAVTMKRMTEFLEHELRDTEVSALLLYFGWVRTVNLGMGFDREAAGMSKERFESITQSPYFVGRAIAALSADPTVKSRSGQAIDVGELALELGFTDVDGRVLGSDGSDLLASD
jgi:NAD(P)-dependent dehydrogenase (short-subunit alcohol dehydrogenase family)